MGVGRGVEIEVVGGCLRGAMTGGTGDLEEL